MISELAYGCILVLIYTIWHIVTTENDRKKKNFAPGAYDLPIIGSTIQLIMTAGISGVHHERMHKICQKYGKVAHGRTMGFTSAMTEDPDLIKEVQNSPDWSGRFPDHPRFREHTLFKNLGLIFSDGEVHREMKKFTNRALRTFGFGKLRISEELIQNEIVEFLKLFEQERNNDLNEVRMHHIFKISTFNVFWVFMAGSRFDYGDPSLKPLIHAAEECAQINIGLDPEWAVPILRFIPGCSPSRAKLPSFDLCHQFFINILNHRRVQGTYKEIQNNYIDYFLHKIDQEKNNPATLFTDEQFQITCVDLLFGSLDTTSNLLEFSILYMAKFPRVQRKVQKDIDTVVGLDRTPTIDDRRKLKYIEATLLELLRICNIAPLNGRTAMCDTKIGDYNVQKGTCCAMNVVAAHMSKDVWGDPENFRPERFLNENNEIINADKIIAFGGGKRHCPGYFMAKDTWFSFFTALLQKHNFSPSVSHPELSTVANSGVTNSPKPFYCTSTLR